MKTLRISDYIHQKLTALLGELVAQTSKMQTYQDAIEAMLYQLVILPPELLSEMERFIQTQWGGAAPLKGSSSAKPYASSPNGNSPTTNT
ncbi:MAG: hypothetical protein ACP5JW_05275 [Candidatus Bathyarchaeia archaeon]